MSDEETFTGVQLARSVSNKNPLVFEEVLEDGVVTKGFTKGFSKGFSIPLMFKHPLYIKIKEEDDDEKPLDGSNMTHNTNYINRNNNNNNNKLDTYGDIQYDIRYDIKYDIKYETQYSSIVLKLDNSSNTLALAEYPTSPEPFEEIFVGFTISKDENFNSLILLLISSPQKNGSSASIV